MVCNDLQLLRFCSEGKPMWDTMCLLHSTGCSKVNAAGGHTLDGNFSAHQGAASKDSTDSVHESPLQKYVQYIYATLGVLHESPLQKYM